MKHGFRIAFVIVASTAIALLIVEGVVRFFTPQLLTPQMSEIRDGLSLNRPGSSGRIVVPGAFAADYRINAAGLRGPELREDRARARIAVLGDSFTFGWGAGDSDAYPAALQRLLPEYEVLNAGICNTGTGHQALVFERVIRNLKPHKVVLTVFSNDLSDDALRPLFDLDTGSARPLPIEEAQRVIGTYSALQRITRLVPGFAYLSERSHLYNLVRTSVARFAVTGQQRLDPPADQSTNPATGLGDPELFRAEVAWLNEQVAEAGATLYLVYVPDRDVAASAAPLASLFFGDAHERITAALERLNRELSIPFLDTTPLLQREGAQGLYYHGAEAHMNPAGYSALAHAVAGFLERGQSKSESSR